MNEELKFGDVIINHHASINNPLRKGIVIRVGNTIRLTDGKGGYWELANDSETKITKIGNICSLELMEGDPK